MRSELGKAVRRRFHEQLKVKLGQFEEVKPEQSEIATGSRLYRWRVGHNLDFYLLLQMHHTEDWFTLELAWTSNGRWPAYSFLPGTPDGEPRDGDLRFRLGQLWADPREDVWWQLTPRPPAGASFDEYRQRVPITEALARVEPLIEDALQRLVHYGLPYMLKVVESLGYAANANSQ